MNTKNYFFLQSALSTVVMAWIIPFGFAGNNARISEMISATICQFDPSQDNALSQVKESAGIEKRGREKQTRKIAKLPAINGLKRNVKRIGLQSG